MPSFSALIPVISFGLFFFVLCKENLIKKTGAVTFDIQRHLFNLIVNMAICLPIIVLVEWMDNGSLFLSGMGSWAVMMIYVGYLFAFENQVAAAILKSRTEILSKAQEQQQQKKK